MDPEVSELFSWWVDWKMFNCLPYGGDDINEQPNRVYEVLRLCEDVAADIRMKEYEDR